MTTREHDHHQSHHPHAHHHRDVPAQLHRLGEDELKDQRLSRRSFLVFSMASLAGSLLAKFDQVFGEPLSSTAEAKRIYIAPDDHTDYMWTADEAAYEQVFLEMLDYYLDLADSTASNSPNSQSRWNCDGSLWMWTYEKNRTSTQFNRLINRIRDGHISVPLNALCVCLGGAPAEAVLRGMYYSGRIERQYNIRFPLAYSMENQTLPYGLGALWSGSGAIQLEGYLWLRYPGSRCMGSSA